MKAIPDSILTMFPPKSGLPLPARPWWEFRHGTYTIARRDLFVEDGFYLVTNPLMHPGHPAIGVYSTRSLPGAQHDAWSLPRVGDSLEEVAARIDREKPIPHPGFRPMQLWVAAHVLDPGVVVVESYRIDAVGAQGWECEVSEDGSVSGIEIYYRYDVTSRGRMIAGIPEEKLRRILGGAFLLFDAVCPHLASWAPAETLP